MCFYLMPTCTFIIPNSVIDTQCTIAECVGVCVGNWVYTYEHSLLSNRDLVLLFNNSCSIGITCVSAEPEQLRR